MLGDKRYWFPAKTYGWGWGFPVAWQGWVVLAAYVVGIVALSARVPPDAEPVRYAAYFTLLTLALLAVCWLKGEPPRWRWGGR
ncbi:hypothetical protein [Cognatilysobacter bugurensis]|uniref:Uncharacterized protein n=1 Tax=Cognatilysobacter bugurensis TaxID=543356 RepID=A0A918W6D1_9GAMM|nr:hypothetical protein [Lysobacter bugurensis]GHA77505.1 hypothetical protein GCM10007067_13690 [Lysobacter bugurensis]